MRFEKAQTPYLAGETAVFDEKRGRALIDAGLAREAQPPAPQPAPLPVRDTAFTGGVQKPVRGRRG